MRVALVGAEIEENLSIRSIGAYLLDEGHEVRIVAFAHAEEQEDVLRALREFAPHLVGLSMVFQLRAVEFMQLATAYRARGFEGHITCGGHFATFNPCEILSDCPAIDSVVRHEGELTMAEMARAIASHRSLEDVHGLVVRTPAGGLHATAPRRPPDDLDSLPFSMRDPQAPHHLDLAVASIVGSRGCYANCAFCCINAWHRASGGRRLRQRSPANIVEEMARLHHDRKVRLFIFHDDNFFVPSREKNLRRFGELKQRMDAAGMRDVGIVVKARPNDVDREVFEVLLQMGLVRVYLGIENGSEGGLKALNRLVSVEDNERAIQVLKDLGVFACFNLLVFEPDTRLEHVADNIAFMGRHLDVPFNFCRTECYTASALHGRLRDDGRLIGNYLGPDYVISDSRVEALFRIFAAAFYERNFGSRSSANAVMGTGYHLHLLRRFHPRLMSRELERRVAEAIHDTNLSGMEPLREALEFVSGPPRSVDDTARFTLDLGARIAATNHQLGARLESLDREMTRLAFEDARAMARDAAPTRPFMKAAAAAPLLALSLLVPGCGPSQEPVDPVPPPTRSTARPPVDMVPPPGTSPRVRTPVPVDPPPPPTVSPTPIDPPPPPTRSPGPPTPPVVDPVPPPPRTPGSSPHGLLPRTLQGFLSATDVRGGIRLEANLYFSGHAIRGAGKAGGGTWVGDDGVRVRWTASSGSIVAGHDGSAHWAGMSPGAYVLCQVIAPDGAVWVGSHRHA